jgi:hypothetical protein
MPVYMATVWSRFPDQIVACLFKAQLPPGDLMADLRWATFSLGFPIGQRRTPRFTVRDGHLHYDVEDLPDHEISPILLPFLKVPGGRWVDIPLGAPLADYWNRELQTGYIIRPAHDCGLEFHPADPVTWVDPGVGLVVPAVCPECGGTGEYIGFTAREPCRACGGKSVP